MPELGVYRQLFLSLVIRMDAVLSTNKSIWGILDVTWSHLLTTTQENRVSVFVGRDGPFCIHLGF